MIRTDLYHYTPRPGTTGFKDLEGPVDKRRRLAQVIYDPLQTVWIEIGDPELARCGSIGIAVPADFDPLARHKWPKQPSAWWKKEIDIHTVDIYVPGKAKFRYSIIQRVAFWLEDYTGPGLWVNTPKAKIKLTARDRIGQPVGVGSFCTWTNGQNGLQFGVVESISDAATLEVRPVDLADGNQTYKRSTKATVRISSDHTGQCGQVLMLNKVALTELMIIRLSI